MIEISECTPGSRRFSEFKRFVRLCKQLPVKMTVQCNVDADDIVIKFPNGLKVRSIMFEGLPDDIVISWLYTLYRLGAKMTLKCESCGKTFLPGANKEGLPNGVGFETEDESIITICNECIMAIDKKFQRCRRGVIMMTVNNSDNFTGVSITDYEIVIQAYSYRLTINIDRFFPVSQVKLLKLFKEINSILLSEDLVKVYTALEFVLTENKVLYRYRLHDHVYNRYLKNILLVRREKEKWQQW